MKRLIAIGALLLAGCGSVQYYAQAVSGHFDVLDRARPIETVLADPGTPAVLRAKLEAARDIRHFAVEELGLPDNGSYRSYADVGRPYVVWNVFAAPEFSVEPHKSCFLFVGCVAYRGYYDLAAAERHAERLREQGYDVFVGGVPAYSTLGWFDDPLLNTFIGYPEAELARLIFHELAHQQVFVKGDTRFNESFAVAVEREGLRRWLSRYGSDHERDLHAAVRGRRDAFIGLVLRYRDKLAAWYETPLEVPALRAGKEEILAAMMADYAALKESWGGYSGYDRWFAKGLNNAHFASVVAYSELVPAFEALLEQEGGDMPRFYAAVRHLAGQDQVQREAILAELGASRERREVATTQVEMPRLR